MYIISSEKERGAVLLIPTIRMLVGSKRCSSERRGRKWLRMDISGGEDEWEAWEAWRQCCIVTDERNGLTFQAVLLDAIESTWCRNRLLLYRDRRWPLMVPVNRFREVRHVLQISVPLVSTP